MNPRPVQRGLPHAGVAARQAGNERRQAEADARSPAMAAAIGRGDAGPERGAGGSRHDPIERGRMLHIELSATELLEFLMVTAERSRRRLTAASVDTAPERRHGAPQQRRGRNARAARPE